MTTPLTAEHLADALGCFHNAALTSYHQTTYHGESPRDVVAAIVEGVNAVAQRLNELTTPATPTVTIPIVDQDNKVIGHHDTITSVQAFVDDQGTTWLPPTAWAYYAACKALGAAKDLIQEDKP